VSALLESDTAARSTPALLGVTIPTWFGPAERPLTGWWHLPPDRRASSVVLICPPLGLEYMNAHRALRTLGESLAACGIAAFRFDYAGTGDSADEERPGHHETLVESTLDAISYLQESRADLPWSVVGLRMGALIAAQALKCAAEPAARFISWDASLSAKTFFRQQRTFGRLLGIDSPAGPWIDGPAVRFPADLVEASRTWELTQLEQPIARRMLVLHRATEPRPPLKASLAAEIEYAEVHQQEELLDVPTHVAVEPRDALDLMRGWLRGMPGAEVRMLNPKITLASNVVETDGLTITERYLELGPHRLAAIETNAVAEPHATVVLLNTSTEHHVGPMRLWPDLARSWAASGVRTIRMDVSGLGDSPTRPGRENDVVYATDAHEEVAASLVALSRDQPPLHLVGFCSGGYIAIRAASLLKNASAVGVNVHSTAEVTPLTLDQSVTNYLVKTPFRRALERVRLLGIASRSRARLRDLLGRLPGPILSLRSLLLVSHSPTRGLSTFAGRHALLLCGDADSFEYLTSDRWRFIRLARGPVVDYRRLDELPHVPLQMSHRTTIADALSEYVERLATTSDTPDAREPARPGATARRER
jgi:alpha-beta hydrolase superfamily lysophospholipase